ncbi:YqiA/YcfP family alpha/beta fold hydrolase [Oxalobacteraceae bacterium A2-2]
MRRAAYTLAASLALAAGPALAAPAPLKLGQMEDGSTLYLASSDGSGERRLVRTRRVYAAPRQVGGASGVLAEVDWQRIDCVARTYETERIEWYANAEGSGAPLQEYDVPLNLRQVTAVRPDDRSAVGVIVNTVCLGGATAVAAQPATPARPPAVAAPAAPSPVPVPRPAAPAAGSPEAPPALAQQRNPPLPSAAPGEMPAAGPGPMAAPQPLPGVGPIAAMRPFADSVFTLGTMGRLAQYIYFDQQQEALLAAVSDKIARARPAQPPGLMQSLSGIAAERNGKALRRYQAAMDAKAEMLAREGLVSEPLPKLGAAPIAAFRAELYRHAASGQLILVFRGSQEALDWVTNLWLGVDLLKLEAPHYQAARELAGLIVKSGRKPIVVGHSLGGGMAQYVGQLYGLKVVAFNSSPLPARYIPARQAAAPDHIRLFSAIEYSDQPNNTVTRADPVSLRLPRFAEDLAAQLGHAADDGLVKAHQHLVQPVCVASRPQPFRNEEEDEQAALALNTMLYPGVYGLLLKGQNLKAAQEQGMQLWIRQQVGRQLDTPAWQPDTRSAFDQRVAEQARKLVATAAIDAYHEARALGKLGGVMYDTAAGSTWKAVSTMGFAMGKALAKIQLGLQFMPHSMERFNRGMQAEVGNDVFVAQAVTAQCRKPASTY